MLGPLPSFNFFVADVNRNFNHSALPNGHFIIPIQLIFDLQAILNRHTIAKFKRRGTPTGSGIYCYRGNDFIPDVTFSVNTFACAWFQHNALIQFTVGHRGVQKLQKRFNFILTTIHGKQRYRV